METKDAVKALAGLAQESRLRVFRLLVRTCPDALPAGEIAAELDIPAPTLSFHLAHLVQAGLVESHREGRSIRYCVNAEGVRGLLGFLLEDCCEGRAELCGGATMCACPPGPLAQANGGEASS